MLMIDGLKRRREQCNRIWHIFNTWPAAYLTKLCVNCSHLIVDHMAKLRIVRIYAHLCNNIPEI